MARYLGPKHRLCRRVGERICDLDRCPAERRPFPPGIHGQKLRRKMSEYGTQLLEKQKCRATYGILERQLRKYYEHALRREGDTGYFLNQILETRLDNVVFRLGMGKSRAMARQIVGHGHVTVNGKRVTIPSASVRPGDVVSVRDTSRATPLFADYPKSVTSRTVVAWLSVDAPAYTGTVLRLPEQQDLQQSFRTQSIVEYYSR